MKIYKKKKNSETYIVIDDEEHTIIILSLQDNNTQNILHIDCSIENANCSKYLKNCIESSQEDFNTKYNEFINV
jgi:hypothetical protein